MKFEEEVINSNYYTSLNYLPKNKLDILKDNKFVHFKEKLFDLYDIDDVYIVDDFLMKESINVKPTLFVKMNSTAFVEFLDRREHFLDDIEVICEVNNTFYKVNINHVEECENPKVRVIFQNERCY